MHTYASTKAKVEKHAVREREREREAERLVVREASLGQTVSSSAKRNTFLGWVIKRGISAWKYRRQPRKSVTTRGRGAVRRGEGDLFTSTSVYPVKAYRGIPEPESRLGRSLVATALAAGIMGHRFRTGTPAWSPLLLSCLAVQILHRL